MAITQVRVKINGTWTNLSKDSATGKWSGSITAPSATSYHLSGGYYPVTVEATNDAGTVKTWETTDTAWGHLLQLAVKETIKPVCTIVSPSNGAYITSNKQAITFRVTDEAGGSGVTLDSVMLKIDGNAYSYNSVGMTYEEITNGWQFVYTPQQALADGAHTITLTGADNDGNQADTVTAKITVDTVPPSLTVSEPAAGLITNNPALTISGVTNDATSSPVTVAVTLNNQNQGSASVGSDGSFAKTVTLAEGTNTIVVTATDAAGKSTSVTRTVKLDTSIPEITTMTLAPNPVDTSGSITITLEVS